MKHIQTFESFLNEQKLASDSDSIAHALGALHPEIAAEAKDVFDKRKITKKGAKWVVTGVKGGNVMFNVVDEDLIDEYQENLEIISRTVKRIKEVEDYWKREIVPKYGDIEYNKMSREAYETSQEKLQLTKSYEVNLMFQLYLEQRIGEVYQLAKTNGDKNFVAAIDRLLK